MMAMNNNKTIFFTNILLEHGSAVPFSKLRLQEVISQITKSMISNPFRLTRLSPSGFAAPDVLPDASGQSIYI